MNTALTIGDYAAICGMTAVVAGSIATVTATYLRGLKAELSGRFAAMEDRLEVLEQDKADRGEWMREMMATRQRIDEMATSLAAIEGKLDASVGIGSAIRGALSAMAEKRHG